MPIYVNDVEITDEDVHQEMQYHPADVVEEARHKAAQALVIRQLLAQKACERGLLAPGKSADGKDADEAIRSLLEQEVSVPEADTASCAHYYEQNLERFRDRKTGSILPLELVEAHIRRYLHARSLRTGISQYIRLLAGKARIAGFELEGSDVMLTQ